jgi:hypothetical protein
MTTGWGSATSPNGKEIPVLNIQRGPFGLGAFCPSPDVPFIVVRVNAPIPASLRATVARLSDDAQRQLTEAIYLALQSNARNGYAVFPPDATNAAKMEMIQVEQILRLDEQDASTFNRLLDAIQELIIAMMRVGRPFALQVQGPAVRPSSGRDPAGMFG